MKNTESRKEFIKKGFVTSTGLLGLSKIDISKAAAAAKNKTEACKKKKIIVEKTKKIYSTPAGQELPYNAFTNMEFWHGKYYIVFRQGEKHTIAKSRIMSLQSTDLENWAPKVIVDTVKDDRDPKLLATPKRLFLYNVPYPSDSEVSYTEDGINWSAPADAYTGDKGDQFWKPKLYNGIYYVACDYNNDRVDLLKSTDGLDWQYAGTIMSGGTYPRQKPTETAIVFLADGRCLALIRLNNMKPSEGGSGLPGFAISSPPYTSWDFTLGASVRFSGHAVERFGDTIVVATRAELGKKPGQWDYPWTPIPVKDGGHRTILCTFNLKTMRLEAHAVLPSERFRDSSYCGLLPTGKDSALVSWYDGDVKTRSDIWLAHIKIV